MAEELINENSFTTLALIASTSPLPASTICLSWSAPLLRHLRLHQRPRLCLCRRPSAADLLSKDNWLRRSILRRIRTPSPEERSKEEESEESSSSPDSPPAPPRDDLVATGVEDQPGDASSGPVRRPDAAGALSHPPGRPPLAAGAAETGAAGKVLNDIERPESLQSFTPRTMPHGECVEGVLGSPGMAGDVRLGVGLVCLSGANTAPNLDSTLYQLLDELPQRTPSPVFGNVSTRMAQGRPGEVPPSSVPAIVSASPRLHALSSPDGPALPVQGTVPAVPAVMDVVGAASPATPSPSAYILSAEGVKACGLLVIPPCVGELTEPHEALKCTLEALGATVASPSGSVGITITTEDESCSVFFSVSQE